jgi:hypothetical protein
MALFICLFVYLSFCSKKKKNCVMLLIKHDYIATMVCISLVCLTC